MKRHSQEQFSAEPEVGVVIAKTTMQHDRLILDKYQFGKSKNKKKGPNSDLYHPFPTHSSNFKQFTTYSSSQLHSGPPQLTTKYYNKTTTMHF